MARFELVKAPLELVKAHLELVKARVELVATVACAHHAPVEPVAVAAVSALFELAAAIYVIAHYPPVECGLCHPSTVSLSMVTLLSVATTRLPQHSVPLDIIDFDIIFLDR